MGDHTNWEAPGINSPEVAGRMIADIIAGPKPRMDMPFGAEKTKPRQILDARWLHRMCEASIFTTCSKGTVPRGAWPEAFQRLRIICLRFPLRSCGHGVGDVSGPASEGQMLCVNGRCCASGGAARCSYTAHQRKWRNMCGHLSSLPLASSTIVWLDDFYIIFSWN